MMESLFLNGEMDGEYTIPNTTFHNNQYMFMARKVRVLVQGEWHNSSRQTRNFISINGGIGRKFNKPNQTTITSIKPFILP